MRLLVGIIPIAPEVRTSACDLHYYILLEVLTNTDQRKQLKPGMEAGAHNPSYSGS